MVKISGPKSSDPTQGAGDAPDVERSGGAGFTNKLDKAEKADGVTAPKVPSSTDEQKKSLVSDIGQDLEAGHITPEAAVDKVVDRVLDNQLGADAPATLRSQVETAMRDALADPVLADKIKSLSG